MEYFITFLEGLISFISPCMLPMLPVYLSYFAASAGSQDTPEESGNFANSSAISDRSSVRGIFRALPGALSFVSGFTVVFCTLGLFSGSVGMLLSRYQRIINVICGIIVIILGLGFLEIIHLSFFKGVTHDVKVNSLASAFLFGMVFSVSLTPCVGAFLGAALMMASSSGSAGKGILLLLVYSLGLGIPFLLSAVLVEQLGSTFSLIKRHYSLINKICGGFLIVVGIAMMTGTLNRLLSILA